MIHGANMLRYETKTLLVREKRKGATLGSWEKVVTTENNAQRGEG